MRLPSFVLLITVVGCGGCFHGYRVPRVPENLRGHLTIMATEEQFSKWALTSMVFVNVFDYDQGCPGLNPTIYQSAYRGTVWLREDRRLQTIDLLSDHRIFFRVGQDDAYPGVSRVCDIAFGFVPQSGARYVLRWAKTEDECFVSLIDEATSKPVPSFTADTCEAMDGKPSPGTSP